MAFLTSAITSGRGSVTPGWMLKSTTLLPSALPFCFSTASRRLSPLPCRLKSTIVVVPPQAAAIEPVFQSSVEVVPMKGMSRCVWGSMAPGRMYLPAASTVSSAFTARPVPMLLILSPSTYTSAL